MREMSNEREELTSFLPYTPLCSGLYFFSNMDLLEKLKERKRSNDIDEDSCELFSNC